MSWRAARSTMAAKPCMIPMPDSTQQWTMCPSRGARTPVTSTHAAGRRRGYGGFRRPAGLGAGAGAGHSCAPRVTSTSNDLRRSSSERADRSFVGGAARTGRAGGFSTSRVHVPNRAIGYPIGLEAHPFKLTQVSGFKTLHTTDYDRRAQYDDAYTRGGMSGRLSGQLIGTCAHRHAETATKRHHKALAHSDAKGFAWRKPAC